VLHDELEVEISGVLGVRGFVEEVRREEHAAALDLVPAHEPECGDGGTRTR
jgi:hypothetical protein